MPCGSCIVSRTASRSTGTSCPATAITCAPPDEPITSASLTPPPSRSAEPSPRPGTAALENSVRLPPVLSSVGISAKGRTAAGTTTLVNAGSRSSESVSSAGSASGEPRGDLVVVTVDEQQLVRREVDHHDRGRMQVLWAQDPADSLRGERSGRRDRHDLAEHELRVAEREGDVGDRPARHRRAAVVDAVLTLLDVEPELVDQLLREDVHVRACVEDEQCVDAADGACDERRMPRRAVGAVERDRRRGEHVDRHAGTSNSRPRNGRRLRTLAA